MKRVKINHSETKESKNERKEKKRFPEHVMRNLCLVFHSQTRSPFVVIILGKG
jgi:hypothetical protein